MTQRDLKQFAKRVLPASLIRSIKRARIARSGPVEGEITDVRLAGDTTDPDVDHLEDRLWLGYQTAGCAGLSEIAATSNIEHSTRARARLALARWFAARGEFESGLAHLDGVSVEWGPLELEATSLYADCLGHLGRSSEALSKLAPLVHRQAVDASTMLRLGSVRSLIQRDPGHGSGPIIEALNHLYERRHLAQLRRADVSESVGLSNVSAPAPPHEPTESAVLVSIIVPATEEMNRIVVALRSLAAQSWTNLEILIVGNYAEQPPGDAVRDLVGGDARIRPIDVPENGGRERLQNVGLAEANGDFIAVHGADEWSHPQRIELLASALRSDPTLQATGTFCAGLSEDRLVRPTDPKSASSLLCRNVSSVMIRRSAIDELGGWDEVPVGSDQEYVERLTARFGSDAIEWLESDVPMSVVGAVPTGQAPDLNALSPAARYRDAFEWWHSSPDFESQLPYWPDRGSRPFPSGSEDRQGRGAPDIAYDVVVVGDLAESDTHRIEAVRLIEQHPGRVGVLHIPSFAPLSRHVAREIQWLAASGKVAVLGGDTPIRCRSVVLLESVLASPFFDGLPAIVGEEAYAVAPSTAPGTQAAASRTQLEQWLGLPVLIVADLAAALLPSSS